MSRLIGVDSNHCDLSRQGLDGLLIQKRKANRFDDRRNGKGRDHVNARGELKSYGPDSTKLMAEVLRHSVHADLYYARPSDRRNVQPG